MNWGFSPALLWTQERMTWHSRLHLVHPINWRETPGRKKTVASLSPPPDSDHLSVFCPASQESAESWANLIGFGSTNKTILRAIWAKLMSPHPQTMFVLNIIYYKVFSYQFEGPVLFFCKNFPLDNIRPYWEWLQYIMACALSKINIWGKLLVSSYIFDVSVSNMNGLCLNIWF